MSQIGTTQPRGMAFYHTYLTIPEEGQDYLIFDNKNILSGIQPVLVQVWFEGYKVFEISTRTIPVPNNTAISFYLESILEEGNTQTFLHYQTANGDTNLGLVPVSVGDEGEFKIWGIAR